MRLSNDLKISTKLGVPPLLFYHPVAYKVTVKLIHYSLKCRSPYIYGRDNIEFKRRKFKCSFTQVMRYQLFFWWVQFPLYFLTITDGRLQVPTDKKIWPIYNIVCNRDSIKYQNVSVIIISLMKGLLSHIRARSQWYRFS